MANFVITHHKFPFNPQMFTVALHKVVGKGVAENNPDFQPTHRRGESFWKLFIHTGGLDSSGDSVGPVIADVFGTEETVNDLVQAKIEELCDLIDWSQQGQFTPETDNASPVIVEQFPQAGQTNVPISSPIVIRVKEQLPGNGIDPSTVSMQVDGFDVVPNAVGNKFDYTFSFKPRPIFDS